MGLCLFANNHVIDHEETRMIDQNKKPTAVSLAGVMCKGENEVGLLRFYKNVKYCTLDVHAALELQHDVLVFITATLHLK